MSFLTRTRVDLGKAQTVTKVYPKSVGIYEEQEKKLLTRIKVFSEICALCGIVVR
jgi:hypothetical protein